MINLTKGFSGKSTLLASTVITSVMFAMTPRDSITLMETMNSIHRLKLIKSMSEILKKKIEEDIDNDIDN